MNNYPHLFVDSPTQLRNATHAEIHKAVYGFLADERQEMKAIIFLGHGLLDSTIQTTTESFNLNTTEMSEAINRYCGIRAPNSRGKKLLFGLITCYADGYTQMMTSLRPWNCDFRLVAYPTNIRNPTTVTIAQDNATADLILQKLQEMLVGF
jgi:hypothetical protein